MIYNRGPFGRGMQLDHIICQLTGIVLVDFWTNMSEQGVLFEQVLAFDDKITVKFTLHLVTERRRGDLL